MNTTAFLAERSIGCSTPVSSPLSIGSLPWLFWACSEDDWRVGYYRVCQACFGSDYYRADVTHRRFIFSVDLC